MNKYESIYNLILEGKEILQIFKIIANLGRVQLRKCAYHDLKHY